MTDIHLELNSSHAWLLNHAIAPVEMLPAKILSVLVENPDDVLPLDVLAAVEQCRLRVTKGTADEIHQILMERAAVQRDSVGGLTHGDGDPTESTPSDDNAIDEPLMSRELLAGDPDGPRVVRLVNSVLADAVNSRASDIHLEPENNQYKIRYRVDGMLDDRHQIPTEFVGPVANRIKVMAQMDVSNRLAPQDGGCSVTFGGKPVDIRVSTVPTPNGERVVIRLLNRTADTTRLEQLGIPDHIVNDINTVLNSNQGMLLVAGPTGSGKTTTLYACLHQIDSTVRNTITIEDPVEYDIAGISQVQVGRDRQLTFADGLRSLLRQDPDIIMVGEIRDGDTAGIALQAALTGHLLLSTIHTTDPAAAVIRLLDLGVAPPLIAETISAVMDQRLIRTLCPHCANPDGCDLCRHTGYLGRTGLYRFMHSTRELQHAIRNGDHQSVTDIVDAACGDMLVKQARELVANGQTDHREVHRVLGAEVKL